MVEHKNSNENDKQINESVNQSWMVDGGLLWENMKKTVRKI